MNRNSIMLIQRHLAVLLAAILWATLTWAGDGHDHGEAPAQAAGPVLPRFYATSEHFELVGVLQGERLALYLDRAADNAPAQNATLELEIGGNKIVVTPHGEGEYEARLAQPLAAGVTPVTATVIAEGESDLLAGELDLHEEIIHTDPPGARGWLRMGGVAGVALLLAGAVGWTIRRKRHLNARKWGGAA
jgi:hypothetical protein